MPNVESIKRQVEEFTATLQGKFRYEEWIGDRGSRMLKAIIIFRAEDTAPPPPPPTA